MRNLHYSHNSFYIVNIIVKKCIIHQFKKPHVRKSHIPSDSKRKLREKSIGKCVYIYIRSLTSKNITLYYKQFF